MISGSARIGIVSWLSSRTPAAPPDLLDRMTRLAGRRECADVDLSATLIDIAATVFPRLADDRESALDLLAADSLITYAMEAAAESGSVSAPVNAMRRIGSVTRA